MANGDNTAPGVPFRDNAISEKFGISVDVFPMLQPSEVDQTTAPYNHDGNVVSGYRGVDPAYRTYADARDKPLASALFSLSEGEMLSEGTQQPETELKPKASGRRHAADAK